MQVCQKEYFDREFANGKLVSSRSERRMCGAWTLSGESTYKKRGGV